MKDKVTKLNLKTFDELISKSENTFQTSFNSTINRNWIPYGRTTNEYGIELMELTRNSSLHGTIVQNKTLMIAGSNFEETNDPATDLFIQKPNPLYSLHQLFSRISKDNTIFGMYAIEVTWNNEHTQPIAISHVPALNVLWGTENEMGVVDHYYFSKDWKRYRQQAYKPILIPRFGTTQEKREILVVVGDYEPGLNYYTFPDYIQGLRSIIIATKVSDYHGNNLDNNFEPGKIITMITNDTSDEKLNEVRAQFTDKYTGTYNAGKAIMNFVGDKDDAPIISPLGDDGNHIKFLSLKEDAELGIITGHGVTNPLLVGIPIAGKLGGGSELADSHAIFYATRILPKRKQQLDTLNQLGKLMGLQELTIEGTVLDTLGTDEEDVNAEEEHIHEIDQLSDVDLHLACEKEKVDFAGKKLKQWKTVQSDVGPCPFCAGLNDQTVPVGKPFKRLGYKLMGTPAHKGCRCEVVYL